MQAPAEWIVRGGFMEGDGYRAMKKLLAVRPRIDAVFAANDPSAIGAMKAIWDAGLRVPEDIAVVGAGDIALGDLLRVPLTTVSWSREDQGRHAAELLLNGLDLEADPPQRIIIPPRLTVRESSGPRLTTTKKPQSSLRPRRRRGSALSAFSAVPSVR